MLKIKSITENLFKELIILNLLHKLKLSVKRVLNNLLLNFWNKVKLHLNSQFQWFNLSAIYKISYSRNIQKLLFYHMYKKLMLIKMVSSHKKTWKHTKSVFNPNKCHQSMSSLSPICSIVFEKDRLKRKSVFMTFLEPLMSITMDSLPENNGIQILIKSHNSMKSINKICLIPWTHLKVSISLIIKLFSLLSAMKIHLKSMLLKSLIGLKIHCKKLNLGTKILNSLLRTVSKSLIKTVIHIWVKKIL